MASNKPDGPEVCVLLSGGMDSSACVAFYLERSFSVRCIFIDYGQDAAIREGVAARSVAQHFHVPLAKCRFLGFAQKGQGTIRGRNAFLLIAALMETPENVGTLALGIHSGTGYVDCASPFIRKMQSVFDAYTAGTVQIGTPFLEWTKADIHAFCRTRNVPLELTYSCELGLDQPCGGCHSCRDLEVLDASA